MGYVKEKQFKNDIIVIAVDYYCRFLQVLYKQRRSLQPDSVFLAYNEMKNY